MVEWEDAIDLLEVITEREERKYSDIPGFDGDIEASTEKALCLVCNGKEVWFPHSQLRKAEDGQSIYASNWILEQKGL